MPVNYQYARQYLGQPVIAHCRGGVRHYGIVHNVTQDGIWLRPMPRGTTVSSEAEKVKAITADKPEDLKGETVFFGFAPFFLPFFTLLALSPFFWW